MTNPLDLLPVDLPTSEIAWPSATCTLPKLLLRIRTSITAKETQ